MFQYLNKNISTSLAVITIVLAVLFIGGILIYQQNVMIKANEFPQVSLKKIEIDKYSISKWQTYKNDEYGFEIKYPEFWWFASTGGQKSVQLNFFGPAYYFGENSDFDFSINVYLNDNKESLDSFILKAESLKKENKFFYENEQKIKVSDYLGYQYETSCFQRICRYVIIHKDNLILALSFPVISKDTQISKEDINIYNLILSNLKLSQSTETPSFSEKNLVMAKQIEKNGAIKEINLVRIQLPMAAKFFDDIKNNGYKLEEADYEYSKNIYETKDITEKFLLSKEGDAEFKNGKIILTESLNSQSKNSAFIDLMVPFQKTDEGISFDYKFLSGGDGDQLGVWMDDQQVFLSQGDLTCENGQCRKVLGNFGFSSEEGSRSMTFALHAYGDINAKVEISNIIISSTDYGIRIEKDLKIDPTIIIPNDITISDAEKSLSKAVESFNSLDYKEAYANAYLSKFIINKLVQSWADQY